MFQSPLETRLRQLIQRGRVLTAPAQLAGYDADGLGYKTFRPDAVVIPADVDELTAILRESRRLDVPVTIRGAGTSLSGGPVAAQGGIVVHTSALRKIRTICREGYWCEAECSVTLSQLDVALKPHGLFYPPDPSSGPVCTLGGNVAMNAGGAHCFRYGVTSNYVLGMEAILADGSVHRFGGPAGGRGPWREDWKRLMIGSEGTLGAFTRFWLRLLPRPEKAWTFRATFSDLPSAERAIHALVADASFPVAIELMDPRCVAMVENSPMAVGLPKNVFLLVTEIEGPSVLVDARAPSVVQLLSDAGSPAVEYSDDELQRSKLWKARKVAGGLMGQISPDFLVQDAVIPKTALAELLQLVYDEADAAGIPAVNVFHAGDGNLHPNFLFDSRRKGELERVEAISKRLMQRVVQVGGTLSGEHGIGNDKTAYMPMVFGPETLKLQLAVPAIFNAGHQLNPLKVFRDRRFAASASSSAANSKQASPPDVASAPRSANGSRQMFAGSPGTFESRLFSEFLDPIDGIACVPATATATQVAALLKPHRLRFPLFTDPHTSLISQVAASEFAPASSRFGPFCDNIHGMNWRLPDGRVVRIGERVVKSTTGYDLLRFLLHTTGRFGQAVDYVIRLRPDCGLNRTVHLSGQQDRLLSAVPELLQSCWMNWFESADVLADGISESVSLRVAMNLPPDEWPVYLDFLTAFATKSGLSLSMEPAGVTPMDGRPDFALKTTPDRAASLARSIAMDHRIKCLALCCNGVVHGCLDGERNPAERVSAIVEQVQQQLFEVGGDWRSRHLPNAEAQGVEAEWLSLLGREFA